MVSLISNASKRKKCRQRKEHKVHEGFTRARGFSLLIPLLKDQWGGENHRESASGHRSISRYEREEKCFQSKDIKVINSCQLKDKTSLWIAMPFLSCHYSFLSQMKAKILIHSTLHKLPQCVLLFWPFQHFFYNLIGQLLYLLSVYNI